ncbi:hypothetical protein Csa_011874 [Cucumis sativus]|nr:hypothetical protein Csa_011874 [Cucumis sativus]
MNMEKQSNHHQWVIKNPKVFRTDFNNLWVVTRKLKGYCEFSAGIRKDQLKKREKAVLDSSVFLIGESQSMSCNPKEGLDSLVQPPDTTKEINQPLG